jgi:CRISPR/Cas system CSM-associated protein Csm3 (group 7 of RAMP superfamily)
MANRPVNISTTLVFQTPPSVAAAGASGSIADRVAERNALGQFIIPGSQLKGKLRHACEQLLRGIDLRIRVCESPRAETMCPNPPGGDPPCPICRVFGNPVFPSSLRFHDLILDVDTGEASGEMIGPSLRAMTGINRRRTTVAENRLFLIETAPSFSELRFNNSEAITGTLENEAQVKLLLAGLKLIPAWGGMKSRGLGWASAVEALASFDNKLVPATAWQGMEQLWTDSK